MQSIEALNDSLDGSGNQLNASNPPPPPAIPRSAEGSTNRQAGDSAYTAEEEALVEERLKNLGYL